MDIVCVGDLLMDMVPAEMGRRLVEVSAFIPKPGGSTANVAVAAARLGARSAFIGKVGEDLFGHALAEALQREGVETRGIRFDADARTTLALIAQPDAQTNEYIFYRNPGADQRLKPEELDSELLNETGVLHFSSLSLTDEPSRSTTFHALQIARARGVLISLDVNYRPTLWRSRDEAIFQIGELLGQAGVLKVNEVELELLTGDTDLDRGSTHLLARGPSLVVVTLGAQGSYFRSQKASGFLPAFKVEAVDSTGCGDAFTGALLVQLVRNGMSDDAIALRAMMEYANAAGAITATRRGAIPAMPTAGELGEFLARGVADGEA